MKALSMGGLHGRRFGAFCMVLYSSETLATENDAVVPNEGL